MADSVGVAMWILSMVGAMLVLPVPVVVKENEIVWRWAAAHAPDVGWPIGLTLVSYEVMAGPLLFMAFFLATSPAVRPIARRARVVYAVFGVAALWVAADIAFKMSKGKTA